jgi:hypothetical protein
LFWRFVGILSVMGRKLFFAQQDETAKENYRKQPAKSGYSFGAHAAEYSIRGKDKRIPRAKRMYSQAVRRWMMAVLQKITRW